MATTCSKTFVSYLDVLDSLFTGQSISGDDGGWMDLLLHKFIGISQELSGDNNNRCCAIANLFILKLSKFNQNLNNV